MHDTPIELRKKSYDRIKADLNDPAFLDDLKYAKNILIVVQREEAPKHNQGLTTNIIYSTDDMPNLIYALSMAKHMILDATEKVF